MVYQDVLRNPNITAEAKGIYAYLAGFAGDNEECYPSISLMCEEMGISKTRLYKHMDILVQFGVVKKVQTYNGNIKGKVIYKLTHTVDIDNFRVPKNKETGNCTAQVPTNWDSEKSGNRKYGNPQDKDTNNNSLKKNSSNNNNNINYQQIADMYNDTCVSYPRLTKLSDSRKKAIRARLKQYSIDDFKRLFQMAEESSFLKGHNGRNWSATFDWLIKDANMAKVLDGNYTDRQPERKESEEGERTQYKSYEEFERELREAGIV